MNMKKLIKYLAVSFSFLMITSCLVDDVDSIEENGNGPNLVGFTRASVFSSVVSDGEDKQVLVPVQLTGPTSMDFEGEFTATIEVDPSSTAVEGVHYVLNSNSVTVSSANGGIATVPITVITEGIEPPLEQNPILKLNITSISNSSILPNGRTDSINITIEYLCFSEITGTYETSDAMYWRIGVLTYDEAIWPAEQEIIYICNNTFRFLEWIGPFNGNEWYFTVDEMGNISYPANTPTGDGQTLNGQPLITCESNPGDMSNVNCDDTNYVVIDGEDVTLVMSVGYFTSGSGPREFYQVLHKL